MVSNQPQPTTGTESPANGSQSSPQVNDAPDEWEVWERKNRLGFAYPKLKNDLGERFSEARTKLDRYCLYDDNQKPVLAAIQRWHDHLGEYVKAGRNLILAGSWGTGKDHLVAALLYRAVREDFASRWFSGMNVFGRVRTAMNDNVRDNEDRIVKDLTSPAVLALSDPLPPTGELKPFWLELMYRVIDGRYRDNRPIWMTINASNRRDDGDERKGTGDLANLNRNLTKLLSPAVWDRLRHDAEILPCFWPSFRGRSSE